MKRKVRVEKNGDIEITYGIHRSPFGWCVIGVTKRAICQLSFLKAGSEREAVHTIHEAWPKAKLVRDQASTKRYIKKIFLQGGGARDPVKNSKRPLHLLIKGTNFQIKVWKALLAIPDGETKNYGAIAKAIGSPKAARAVGSACGKNSIAYLIPCHRVLTAGGGIGGYRWGTAKKKAILAAENVRLKK